jgi:SAM-dependent methyltransferase
MSEPDRDTANGASRESQAPQSAGPPGSTQPDAKTFAHAHAANVELGVPSLVWGPGQERRLQLIRDRIPLTGRRVLDIGCGLGQYVRRIAELAGESYGIDIEAARVRAGGRVTPGLLLGSADALPFADRSFDVILLNEVIEHVADERLTMREAARVLRPGGHLVIYAPNRGFPFETHGVQWRGRYRFGNFPLVNYLPHVLRDRLVPHARVYRGRELQRLWSGLPFRTIERTVVYPGFDGIRSRNEPLGRALQATLHRAESTPLRAFGLSHFVILERRDDAEGGAPS